MYRAIRSELRYRRCSHLGFLALIVAIVVVGRYIAPTVISFSSQSSPCVCSHRSQRSIIEDPALPHKRSILDSLQSGENVFHFSSELKEEAASIGKRTAPEKSRETIQVGKDAANVGSDTAPVAKDAVSLGSEKVHETVSGGKGAISAASQSVKDIQATKTDDNNSVPRPTASSPWSEKLQNLTANLSSIARRSESNLQQQRQLWSSVSPRSLMQTVLEKGISRSTRAAMKILLGMEWLEEEEFFKNNHNYFANSLNQSEFLMPKLLMGETSDCDKEGPFLLVLVPSVANHSVMRHAIRHTWASPAYQHFLKWPMGVNITEKVKLVFVIGRNESLYKNINHNSSNTANTTTGSSNTTSTTTTSRNSNDTLLMKEQREYGDIVQYDFKDSYRNLTLKMMTAFHWVATYCPTAKFVLKADEDTFVHLPVLVRLLRMVFSLYPRFVMGSSIRNSTVLRKGKWRVNTTDYPLPLYPDYMVGHSYVITGDVIPELLHTARRVPLIPIEDAFFTGIVAGMLRVPKLCVDVMAATERSFRHCDIMKGHYVSQTHFKNKTLLGLWDQAKSGRCGTIDLSEDIL